MRLEELKMKHPDLFAPPPSMTPEAAPKVQQIILPQPTNASLTNAGATTNPAPTNALPFKLQSH
jgi:hypothetical protein